MGMKPSNQTCTGDIQKYIGTSFDITKGVYDNLEFIKTVYDAIVPAYSADFMFNNLNGWTLLSGTMTPSNDGLFLGKGHIKSPVLNFNSTDNKVIQIGLEYVGITNWIGDIVLHYEDFTTVTLSGVIPQPTGYQVLNIDLSEVEEYQGTIKQIELLLAEEVTDQVVLKNLVITSGFVAISTLGEFTKRINLIYDQTVDAKGTADLAISLATDVAEDLVALENETTQAFADMDAQVVDLENTPKLIMDGTNTNLTGVVTSDASTTKTLKAAPNAVEFVDSTGDVRYYWNSVEGQYVHKGNLILGDGTSIKSVEDIRALDGQNVISIYLTQDAFNAPTDSAGTNIVYAGSGGSIVLVQGVNVIESGVVYSGTQTKNNITITVNSSTGIFSISGNTWSTDSEFFDLTATYNDTTYTKRYTVTKNRQGSTGIGLNTGTLTIYRRTARGGTPPELSNNVSYNFLTQTFSGLPNNGWTATLPDSTLPLLWVKQILVSTSLTEFNVAPEDWSVSRLLSTDGVDGADGDAGSGSVGAPGAGMYGGAFSTFDWTLPTANTRFESIVGRQPVFGDIFVQTNTTNGQVQSRQWNGSSWVTPSMQIDGSLIATDTVAGDKIIAGSFLRAPIMRGGRLELTGEVSSAYMSIISNDPFGPNDLVEWYGPKNVQTWDSVNQAPIFSGMLKSNAKTYKDNQGNVYFGGTFQVGAISNGTSSSTLTANPSTEVIFSSNGGVIEIAASFSFNATIQGDPYDNDDVDCPVTPTMGVVTGTLFLERWNGSSWVIQKQETITGSYSCTDGTAELEPGNPNIPYNSNSTSGKSFTFTDNLNLSGTRRFRARASLSNYFTAINMTQFISIATVES